VQRDKYGRIKKNQKPGYRHTAVADGVNWEKVVTVLREKAGLAGHITL
jgi:hypothetical protein